MVESNTMVTSDFRPEAVVWPFRVYTMQNIYCNPYLWTNNLNSRVLQEVGVKEVNGDVRFQTGCRNMTRIWGKY